MFKSFKEFIRFVLLIDRGEGSVLEEEVAYTVFCKSSSVFLFSKTPATLRGRVNIVPVDTGDMEDPQWKPYHRGLTYADVPVPMIRKLIKENGGEDVAQTSVFLFINSVQKPRKKGH